MKGLTVFYKPIDVETDEVRHGLMVMLDVADTLDPDRARKLRSAAAVLRKQLKLDKARRQKRGAYRIGP